MEAAKTTPDIYCKFTITQVKVAGVAGANFERDEVAGEHGEVAGANFERDEMAGANFDNEVAGVNFE